MTAQLLSQEFRAMGTTCAVAVTVEPNQHEAGLRALAAARTEIAECERVLTRFDPRSDLSRLNAASGSWLDVDVRVIGALKLALRGRRETGGRFDPTVLPALLAAGYDRTFDRLDNRPPRRAEGWRAGAAVAVDDDHCRARVEAGAAVDLGGVGKGYSAMRALDAMWAAARDLAGGFVDLGGDLAFRGLSPEGGSWRIGVADPHGGAEPLALLGVQGAGVATSGRDRRRFGPGRALHHLIDPVTGDPAVAGPLAVTVVAPDAAEAEIHATALAISDVEEARAHVARTPHVSALFVPESAPPVVLGALPTVPRFRLVRAA